MLEEEASKLVVPDEPNDAADPATVVTINFRMPDMSKKLRKFLKTDKI